MISENIKIKNCLNSPTEIIRVFLALVFLAAGIFRIFNPVAAELELLNLRLPLLFSWPLILFEILAGLGLLLNKYVKYIYYLLIVFLVFILIWAFVLNGRGLTNQVGELFAFNLTPTDIFLHFIFLLLVFASLFSRNTK